MGTSGQQGQTLAQFGCGLDIDIWPTDADRLFQSKRILFLPVLCDFRPQTFVELLRSSRKRNKREPPFVGHPDDVFAPIFFRRIRVPSEPWKMRLQVGKRVDRSARQVGDVTVELRAPIVMLEQNSHQGTGASAVKSARLGIKQSRILSE